MMEKGVYANGDVDISLDMLSCRAIGGDIIQKRDIDMLRELITLERAEREKNPGVWDGAPELATLCLIKWLEKDQGAPVFPQFKEYTRTLPKTKAREIAEKWAGVPTPTPTRPYLADIIESAINEALGGEK